MSTISLERIKTDLQVIHEHDDSRIQSFLDGAEQECMTYLGRKYLPTEDLDLASEGSSETDPVSENESPSEASDSVARDVYLGIYLIVKCFYDDKDSDPIRGALDLPKYRERAEELWAPYRIGMGV